MRYVLKRHKDITRVIIFGSRAKGTYHKNSDIDIAVEGISANLSIEALALEFEELPL
ncbi:MAG: nucleotidyltransferase family protein [Clostridiales bacterium]